LGVGIGRVIGFGGVEWWVFYAGVGSCDVDDLADGVGCRCVACGCVGFGFGVGGARVAVAGGGGGGWPWAVGSESGDEPGGVCLSEMRGKG
jgi:hypothetical protein